MSFRLVLFDVDGTLLRAGGAGRWAMARAIEQVFGLPDADPFTHPVRFEGNTDPGILAEIAHNAAIPQEELRRRAAEIQQAFLGHLEARLRAAPAPQALPGVMDLLDRLAPVSIAGVGLLTGNVRAGAMLKLASVALDRYFTLGGFGEDAPDRAGIGMVARQRFQESLHRGIEPQEVFAIGDSTEDIRAAKTNGFRSISVGTGWTDPDLLRSLEPDLFVDDLSDYGSLMQFIFGSKG